jgi:hypothetical protein
MVPRLPNPRTPSTAHGVIGLRMVEVAMRDLATGRGVRGRGWTRYSCSPRGRFGNKGMPSALGRP